MYSYAVTIGRNVPATNPNPMFAGKPMTLTTWETFKDDVAEALRVAIEKTRETDGYMWPEGTDFWVEAHHGKGIWQGVEEESTKVTVLSDEPITHLHWLRQELTELAREYGQDAIALTIGESELC